MEGRTLADTDPHGAGATVSHLLADVITPMGIRPLHPFRATVYTFDVVRASDPRANLFLLSLGAVTVTVAYAGGRRFQSHTPREQPTSDRASTDTTT